MKELYINSLFDESIYDAMTIFAVNNFKYPLDKY